MTNILPNLKTVIEFMPRYLRSSHEAAGNAGFYPHNGSCRVAVTGTWAGEIDPVWSEVVTGADPSKYPEVADDDWNDILCGE